MSTLEYIGNKYQLNLGQKVIQIRNINRESLAQLFSELNFMFGAEIGVERGLYSDTLLRHNPQLTLYSIDAWTAYSEYRDHVTQSKLDGIMGEAKSLLEPYGRRSVMIKGFSEDVVNRFEDGSLDFVYIDGNHEYRHVVNDICLWQKKVRIGGIISGHDYIRRKVTHKKQEYLMHVIPALHGFVDAYNIAPLFIAGTKEKVEGELRDSPRSWFYVKPESRKVVPGFETT